MPLQIDAFNELILVTSPDTSVSLQVLHDFVEDYMASPVGMTNDSTDSSFLGDILKPEGKIEDPSNPGSFSQIILLLNSRWQVQFWQGSGYTRVFGGKLVGGLNDEPIKATGAAGDITVLESPVDGTYTVVPGGLTQAESDAVLNTETKVTAMEPKIDDIHDESFGSWIVDPDANTLTLYRVGESTPWKVFDLGEVTNQPPFYVSRTPQ